MNLMILLATSVFVRIGKLQSVNYFILIFQSGL